MSSASVDLALTHGARLRLPLPEGARAEPDSALPPLDVSNLPGAAVIARVGYRGPEATIRAACVGAPSRGYAPGVEGLVLGRASQIARAAVEGEELRFQAGDVVCVDLRFEQRFSIDLRRAEGAHTTRGRHLLGFAGEARHAIVCSVICSEPEGKERCDALVTAASPEGAWLAPPSPSPWVAGILSAAEHPAGAVALVTSVALGVIALVLARRPRPTVRRRSSPARAAHRGPPSSPARTSDRT